MLMPSPLPSPVSSNRKSILPDAKRPIMRHSDSDSQSESSSTAQAQREEAHMKRLVHMAKQQQSLMTAWFAASSGRDVAGSALPPRRSPSSSSRLSPQSSRAAGPVDVDSVNIAVPKPVSRQKSAPVDVDTLSEQSVASQSSSSSSSASRKSFFQLVFPVTPSTASSQSEGSETIKMSNVTDVEQGIPVGDGNTASKWPLRRRVIGGTLFCILILAVITVVVSVIISGRDGGGDDLALAGQSLGKDGGLAFPTSAPTLFEVASSTKVPSQMPSLAPSWVPSESPSSSPSLLPTAAPSGAPSPAPSPAPSASPTRSPAPSMSPTQSPTTIFSTSEFETLITLTGEQLLEQYGYTVAVSGDGTVIAVGAPNYSHNANLTRSGRVQVFEHLPRQWRLKGQTLLGRNELDQFGYAVSLNKDGSRLAISEPGFDGPVGDRSGNVRVFDYDYASTWILSGDEIGGEAVADLFGLSLALSGNGKRLAVGSPYHDGDDNVNLNGRVRVFEYKDKSWKTVGEALDGPQSLDWFGWAVDLSFDGMEIAVGAPRNTKHGGFVRCFEWNKGTWAQTGSDIINNVGDSVQLDDRFGMAVSLSSDGKRLAVGSPWKDLDSRIRKSGLVAVYQLTGNEWTLWGDVFAGRDPNNRLGWSLQLSGDYLAIGIPGLNQVTFHQWTGTYWDTVSTPLQADQQRDDYGHSIATSSDGSVVVVGATESSQGGTGFCRVMQRIQV